MSQEVISQKIRRICQGCELTKEFELIGAGPETIEEMSQWYSVIREVFDPETGHFIKMIVQACSLACVPAAAVRLALPPKREEPEIDLESLRTAPEQIN